VTTLDQEVVRIMSGHPMSEAPCHPTFQSDPERMCPHERAEMDFWWAENQRLKDEGWD
jgi:hypothetical protein